MKLPFRLVHGVFGKLFVTIPWKSNFTTPTSIEFINVQWVWQVEDKNNWEFLDFYSYEKKLSYWNTFFNNKWNELSKALCGKNQLDKTKKELNYWDKVKLKILNNWHIYFKDIHVRIEDCTGKDNSAFGFTWEELLILNTNDKWEEPEQENAKHNINEEPLNKEKCKVVNDNDTEKSSNSVIENESKDENTFIYKVLKIKNFGFYWNSSETWIWSTWKTKQEKLEAMNTYIVNKEKLEANKTQIYLINPISITARLKQLEKGSWGSGINSTNHQVPKNQIWIILKTFEINFTKIQYDTIVRLLNNISQYQRFQFFKQESQRYNYTKPWVPFKDNYLLWWRYSIKTVIKRSKFYRGNFSIFKINDKILSLYHKAFSELFSKYLTSNLNEAKAFTKGELALFKRIIQWIEWKCLYEWSVDNIQEYFKNTNNPKTNKNSNSVLSYFTNSQGNKGETTLTITAEEEKKLTEIIENLKYQVKNHIIYTEKEIKLKLHFTLIEGSFNFINFNSVSKSLKNFGFIYSNLAFTIWKSDVYTEIETSWSTFHLQMSTQYINQTLKKFNITLPKKQPNSSNDYIWKLKLQWYGPGESNNISLSLHINSIDIIYHQSFIERVINFFIVKYSVIDDDLSSTAWEKYTELKEKTSETLNTVIRKKNNISIEIEPRKVIWPLNKYDYKNSKMLILDIGKFTIKNTPESEDDYIAVFSSINIVHFPNFESVSNESTAFYIVNNWKMNWLLFKNINGINTEPQEKTGTFKWWLNIDDVNVKWNEEIYYSLHFFPEVLKPTHQEDYWAVIEENANDIKKNCKVFSKVNKKDNINLILVDNYEECYAVLSGGYIYFYNNVQDSSFDSFYFIRNSTVTKILVDEERNYFEWNVENKYGNMNLVFSSLKKFEQFYIGLIERINEMKIDYSSETEGKPGKIGSENNKAVHCNTPADNSSHGDNNNILVSINVNVDQLSISLLDNITNQSNWLFTWWICNTEWNAKVMKYEKHLLFSIFSVNVYDESQSNNKNLYQWISSINPSKAESEQEKLVNISIILTDKKNANYAGNNSDINITIEFGYLFSVWNSYSIRRILLYLAHNDILRSKIKDEILAVPSQSILNQNLLKLNQENNIWCIGNDATSPSSKPNCLQNQGSFWVKVKASMKELRMIWIQPYNKAYFMEVIMGSSTWSIDMTVDDFRIIGSLGNWVLYDWTNYPYSTIDNITDNSDNDNPTEILRTSISIDFTSYSIFCPWMKNNISSDCTVIFNSVQLNYIHELFFRGFNYLFDEFLGSWQPSTEIKTFKNKINKLPLTKTWDNFEFLKVKVIFKNPKIILKAREKFSEYFIGDLGIITITNSYSIQSGRIRLSPLEERYINTYEFKLENVYFSYCEHKIIECATSEVMISLPCFINDEDLILNESEIDKSININMNIKGCIQINLNQNAFRYWMKCVDLNLNYQDYQNCFYDYKELYFKLTNNPKTLSKNKEQEKQWINPDNDYDNYIDNSIVQLTFALNIDTITLSLVETFENKAFLKFQFTSFLLDFTKKVYSSNEITLKIIKIEGYNYNNSVKEKILFIDNTGTIPETQGKQVNNNNNNNNHHHQLLMKVLLDKDDEKNIILKISNIKMIIYFDIISLIKMFLLDGLPIYNEGECDWPNQYDPDIDNKPGWRVNFDVKNIWICLVTSKGDAVCCSCDLYMLFKKEKILSCKEELKKNYDLFTNKINEYEESNDTSNVIKFKKELAMDFKEMSSINISLYDISPFKSKVSDILSNNNNTNKSSFHRQWINKFNFTLTWVNMLKYIKSPNTSTTNQAMWGNNFVWSNNSSVNINNIICKWSYSDLVLFYHIYEYNSSRISSTKYHEISKTWTQQKYVLPHTFKTMSSLQRNISNVKKQRSCDIKQNNYMNEIIDKGMGVDEINISSLRITLIDDHANTYYPFLSFIHNNIKLINEKLSREQSVIHGLISFKIVMYNYYVGVWEPLLERVNWSFEKSQDESEKSVSHQTWKWDIRNRDEKVPMNINISDITLTFLYSTLKLWIDKYYTLSNSYKYHTSKSKTVQDKAQTISNHSVLNWTGREMTIYWINFDTSTGVNESRNTIIDYEENKANISNSKEVQKYATKVISTIKPNNAYEIEYYDYTNNSLNIREDNTQSERYLSFSFSDITVDKISDNYIKIDQIQSQKHVIDFSEIIEQYQTNTECSKYQYWITHVNFNELKKQIVIYSPLIFYNKWQTPVIVKMNKKKYTIEDIVKPRSRFSIPFEYFDGNIEFKLNLDDHPQVFNIRKFWDFKFMNTEMRFDYQHICLFGNNNEVSKNKIITITISTPYAIRNCLPFNVNLKFKNKEINVGKGRKVDIDSISLYENLVCEQVKVGPLTSKDKFVLYYTNNNKINIGKNRKNNSFIVYDLDDNPVNIQFTIWTSTYHSSSSSNWNSKCNNINNVIIILHCTGIIYNSTMKYLKWHYWNNGDSSDIPGQSIDSNISIINDQQKLVVEWNEPNNNYISSPVPWNAIGLITNFELNCLNRNSNTTNNTSTNTVKYEFTLEEIITPIADDLPIFTTIVTIHPKYIVCNKTNNDIYISNSNNTEPIIVHKGQSSALFFTTNNEYEIMLRPIEAESQFQSGSKWNWSFPINISQTGIITIQIYGINPHQSKKYINIEKQVQDYSTFIWLSETNFSNSQFMIENYSNYINMRIYQVDYEFGAEFIKTRNKKIFAWSNNSIQFKKLKIEFLFNGRKSLNICPISNIRVFSFFFGDINKTSLKLPMKASATIHNNSVSESNASHNYNNEKILFNDTEYNFPFIDEFTIAINKYVGYKVKLEWSTDGVKKTLRWVDYIYEIQPNNINITLSHLSPAFSSYPTSRNLFPYFSPLTRTHCISLREINLTIQQIGINIITDNRSVKNWKGKNRISSSYQRKEICYITLKGIQFYYKTETTNLFKGLNSQFQCKIKAMQIDNMHNYITQYPIVLHESAIDYEKWKQLNSNNKEIPPFFNVAASFYKLGNQSNEPTKFHYFSYLIQSFDFSVENEWVDAILNFIMNVSSQLNTSINQADTLLRKSRTIKTKNSNEYSTEKYIEPSWWNSDTIVSDTSRIYFENFETSSIEMTLSFKAGEIIEKYITTNPVLCTFLSTITNIEKANLKLNGSEIHNIYISTGNLFKLALNKYMQSILTEVLSIFGAIDVLGNPSNLFKSLGTGVKDFFNKPIEGIVKGPLTGFEGAIEGGYSLIKHTITGTFNATSKIATGISKGWLHLSQDEDYLKQFEKQNWTRKPKNFVDGLGYGITSITNGWLNGICDIVAKPIEETQKRGITGIGSGIAKGVGGWLSKPVVGVWQWVSTTSDGIKNIFSLEDIEIKQQRQLRPFYGNYKYYKTYNSFHAYVLEYIKTNIDSIKNDSTFIFYEAEYYENIKGEVNFLVFTRNEILIIDKKRKEIKMCLPYSLVKEVLVGKNQSMIRIVFNNKWEGKCDAVIYFNDRTLNGDIIAKKIMKALKDNLDSIK